ncbi:MAG: acyl-CoA dehydratase activase [Atopobiaceae bacterium]
MADEIFYACKYTPLELFAGFGTKAHLAETDASDFQAAATLAHANLCGYAKGMLERLLEDDVHEVMLVTCCDAVKRVYDVLREEEVRHPGRYRFLYLLDLPRKRGPRETALFRSRLAALARSYAAATGKTFDLGRALAAIEPAVPIAQDHVTVAGAHAAAPLLSAIERELALPVENATCTSRHLPDTLPRSLARMERQGHCELCGPDETKEPLEAFLGWYAGALLGQMPCMRMQEAGERAQLFSEKGERGFIYHTMKFCDYYGFEIRSQKGDIPTVKIETDGSSQSAGQLATRIEAFTETIGAKRQPEVQKTGQKVRYVLGIDSGSTSTDAVLMDADGHILATSIIATGAKASRAAEAAKAAVLDKAGLSPEDIGLSVATGYGRMNIPGMNTTITEITCHAAGAHFLMPAARSIIDIGGQDSKAIHLSPEGEVLSFAMNDKCAAGTGRFLEMMARTLELPLDEFCRQGLAWKHEVKISRMCTVFAESEVVSLVAQDTPVPDIIHGLDVSVAAKTVALAKRVHAEGPYLMTGGVAQNAGVVTALSEALGSPVATHPDSQLCGAIGAALLGLEGLRR